MRKDLVISNVKKLNAQLNKFSEVELNELSKVELNKLSVVVHELKEEIKIVWQEKKLEVEKNKKNLMSSLNIKIRNKKRP